MPGKKRQRHRDMETTRRKRGNPLTAVGMSPFLWGGAMTVAFYQFLPYLPFNQAELQRYFCAHWTEYCIAGMFFLGLALLILKHIALLPEKAAMHAEDLHGADLAPTTNAVEMADQLESHVKSLPSAWRESYLIRRIADACAYVKGRGSAAGLEDHLKYLSDQAFNRMDDSLGLVRNVNWAVPILGFLGTVIGITIAIANVALDPEQLKTSLPDVISGLAVAFDTTALALTLSLILVFFLHHESQTEKGILDRVEDFGNVKLLFLFPQPVETNPVGTIAEVQHNAAKALLERTEAVIQWQTDLWKDSLESLRSRWNSTLADQQDKLAGSLEEGMALTFANHAQQLAEIRDGFAEAFQQISQHVQQHLSIGQAKQNKHMSELISLLADRTTTWQNQMEQTTTAVQEQIEELKKQKDTLLRVVAGEQELVRLQSRLTENLEAVRTSEAFEQTLHSLSAAVHLLTARNQRNAA